MQMLFGVRLRSLFTSRWLALLWAILVLLTALNLAREVVEERDTNASSGADPKRLRALIELAESALSMEAG